MKTTEQRIEDVTSRVDAARARAGRADAVTIVTVTKTWGAEKVREMLAAGMTDIGENRVQELIEKRNAIAGEAEHGEHCRWHLLGPLQRNKAGKVVGSLHLMHSLDSLRIAETVSRLGVERQVATDVLIQVNMSREESKHGFAPDDVLNAVEAVATMEQLRLRGLMTIGPLGGESAAARACFQSLYELRERVKARCEVELPELSMGMSGDFEEAIEEGATIIRIGTALTGPRVIPRPL